MLVSNIFRRKQFVPEKKAISMNMLSEYLKALYCLLERTTKSSTHWKLGKETFSRF